MRKREDVMYWLIFLMMVLLMAVIAVSCLLMKPRK